MQPLSKCNKGNKYLLCAIDLFSKYVWVVPIKVKKGVSIVNAFQKINSEGRKLNKIWVDQGSEFYNNSFKDFLKINNIEMHSIYNEGKSVVATRFIRTLKNKIFKHMTEFQNKKTFLLKDILQIGQKKFSLLVKLKIQFLGLMLLVTWMVKKLLEVFMKKNCKKLVKKNLEEKKYLKENGINFRSNGKGMIIHLIVGLIKKISYKIESLLS